MPSSRRSDIFEANLCGSQKKYCKKEVDRVKKLARECMESVMKLDVPLVVNISVGKNLAKV